MDRPRSAPTARRVVTGGSRRQRAPLGRRDAPRGRAMGGRARVRRSPLASAVEGDDIVLGFSDGTIVVTNGSLASPHELVRPARAGSVQERRLQRRRRARRGGVADGRSHIVTADGSGVRSDCSGPPDASRRSTSTPTEAWSAISRSTGPSGSGARPTATADTLRQHGTGSRTWPSSPERRWVAGRRATTAGPALERSHGTRSSAARRAAARRSTRWPSARTDRSSPPAARTALVRVWTRSRRAAGGDAPRASGHGCTTSAFGPGTDARQRRGRGRCVSGTPGAEAWSVPSGSRGLDFNRDGRLIVTAATTAPSRVWDVATGRLVGSRHGGADTPSRRSRPPTTRWSSPTTSSPDVRVWSRRTAPSDGVPRPQGHGVDTAGFDPSGERIVYADTAGRLAVRDLDSGDEVTLDGGPKRSTTPSSAPTASASPPSPRAASAIWRLDRPGDRSAARGPPAT